MVFYLNQATLAESPTTGLPATSVGATPVTVKELGRASETTQSSITSAHLPTGSFQLVAAFVSDLLDPAVASIPAGLWDLNFWASSTANYNNQTVVQVKLYKYNGTTATLISTSDDLYIYDPSVVAKYASNLVIPAGTTLNPSDRIYLEILAKGSSNNYTITLKFGDGTPTHIHTTIPGVSYARTKIVGVDAETIQGCLDLITDASSSNPAQVLIPPGFYTENLTFKGCVLVSSIGHNNGQTDTVRITGTHTFVGGATEANNLLQLSGLRLNSTSTSSPTISLTTQSGVNAIVHMQNCVVGNTAVSTSAVGVYVGPDVILKIFNVRSEAYSVAGQGGTHFDIHGGSLYASNLAAEFGTCAILMSSTNGALKPYTQILNSTFSCSGSNVVDITSTTALFTAGWTSFTNLAATGNGFNVAAGSVIGVYASNFAIQAGASNYVVTGAAGSFYYALNNGYSNALGATFETKINSNVTQLLYSSSTYLTGSATYNPPALASGASTTTTVTCTGATTSHFAEAVLSSNTGLTLYAYVSSANTVTVRLTNQTAGNLDVASGTLKVRASL